MIATLHYSPRWLGLWPVTGIVTAVHVRMPSTAHSRWTLIGMFYEHRGGREPHDVTSVEEAVRALEAVEGAALMEATAFLH